MHYWRELDKDTLISCLPKNGSNTIDLVTTEPTKDISAYNTRVFFLREPLDRVKSAYNFFKYLAFRGDVYRQDLSDNIDSYEKFVDFILTVEDEHWMPQNELVSNWTEKKNLTELNQFIYDKLGFYPPIENQSVKYDIDTNYRKQDLLDYYRGDYQWLS